MTTHGKTHDRKTLGDSALDSARQAWLAGLGAVSVAQEEASDLFEHLVERGRKLEARGRKEADKARGRVASSIEDLGNDLGQALDRGLAATLGRLGIPTRDDLKDLTRRVEELTKSVSRLSRSAVDA
jgi:poly(hydroxyalkanoate) granule-associated protein